MPLKPSPVRRILSLLKREKAEITAVYFYAILNGLIQLSLPIGVQAIVGFVLGASMRASLVVLIALVVLGVLVAGIMQVNQMKIIEKIQQKLFTRYSFAFAEHLPAMDLRSNDHLYLPELINRFFDIPVLQKSLSKILLDIPTASVQIIFGLLLLCLYHPAFIAFSLVLVVILWLIIKYSSKKGVETSLKKSTFKYKVAAWLEEAARAAKSIKYKNLGHLHLQKTDDAVGNYITARTSHFKILLFQYNVLVVFKTVITAAMLIVGTILLVNQQLNIGQFIAAEIVILLVLNAVEKLIVNLGSVYDTLTAVEKLSNLTDTVTEENGKLLLTGGNQGLKLEMKDLSFGFEEAEQLFTDVNLQLLPGERACIVGEEGGGKSALLQLMGGAYTGYGGSLLINDVPLANYDLASVREKISWLIHEGDIFMGSLWENITLGDLSIQMDTVISFSRAIGLQPFVSSLHEGFDTMLDPAGRRLPARVRYKILLLRALVSSPRLLLLDDPWKHIEASRHNDLEQLLNSLAGTTIVITTDDRRLAKGCTKLILINDGAVQVQENNLNF